MNTTDLVHYVSTGERPRPTTARRARSVPYHELVAPLRLGIVRARQQVRNQQRADGSWCGSSIGDVALVSQWVMLLAYLGQEHSEKAEQAARTILAAQLPCGGWASFPGGPLDPSTSVQAYFALKLAGCDPTDQRLTRARDAIRSHGGAERTDLTTRLFLALLGQIDYDCCPVLAPEILLFADSTSPELVALAVLWSHRPVRDLGLACGIRELFVNKSCDWGAPVADPIPGRRPPGLRWKSPAAKFFCRLEQRGWTPLRRRSLDRVEAMLLRDVAPDHLERLAFHELVVRLIALDTLGHGEGSEPFEACHARICESVVVDDDRGQAWPRLRITPLADTALSLRACRASGISLSQLIGSSASSWLARPQLLAPACDTSEIAWLLESLRAVDDELAEADESLPPHFQVANEDWLHPAAARPAAMGRRARCAAERFVSQLIARQNSDGGWAPNLGTLALSSPDATGAMLEALADCGSACVQQSVERAVRYLRTTQRADGSWPSATGVYLVHGTALAVCGLLAAGVPPEDEAVAAGVNWLIVHQLPSGGWGESPRLAGHDPDDFLAGPATATQTAWALMALVAAGQADHPGARRAVNFLLETQEDDGRWREPHFTRRDATTGRWFRSELHQVAWALLALSRWAIAAAAEDAATDHPSLRLVSVADD